MRVVLFLWLLVGGVVRAQSPTIGEIQARTDPATFKLAFHFVATADSSNFSASERAGNNELLRAAALIPRVVGEMNKRFANAVVDTPDADARIRFRLVNGEEVLESVYFYGPGERPRMLPEAMNVIFQPYGRGRAPTASTDGAGSNRVRVYDQLAKYQAGGNDYWSVARAINHEIGHTQNLDHTFKCDNPCGGVDIDVRSECHGECATNNSGSVGSVNCYGASDRELMMGYGSQVYLTVCETEQLWTYLLSHRQPWVDYGYAPGAAPW